MALHSQKPQQSLLVCSTSSEICFSCVPKFSFPTGSHIRATVAWGEAVPACLQRSPESPEKSDAHQQHMELTWHQARCDNDIFSGINMWRFKLGLHTFLRRRFQKWTAKCLRMRFGFPHSLHVHIWLICREDCDWISRCVWWHWLFLEEPWDKRLTKLNVFFVLA